MPDYIVNGTDLTSVANAIRTAGGTSESLTFPSGFVSAIGNLGGSSDFSTAEVTLNLTPPEGVTLTLYDLGDVMVPLCGVFYAPDGGFLSSENNTITVPLGKDEDGTLKFGFGNIEGNDDESLLYIPDGTVTLSGAIEEITIEDNIYYIVTGDCSITCNVALGY